MVEWRVGNKQRKHCNRQRQYGDDGEKRCAVLLEATIGSSSTFTEGVEALDSSCDNSDKGQTDQYVENLECDSKSWMPTH